MRSRLAPAALALLLVSAQAGADARVSFLAGQLEKGTDPRTRILGAAGLGKSHQAAAVKPLCAALSDPDETVRITVVKALGEVGQPAAIACLRKPGQQPADVQDEIAFILEPLDAGAGKKPSFYLSMAPLVDKSGALQPKVLRFAERRLRAQFAAMGGILAPPQEDPEAAKKVLKGKKLKGYHLQVLLESTPEGGLQLNLACFTYPGKNLIGAVKVGAHAEGAEPEDLLEALAPKAVEEVADTFARSKR